jgi:cell division protein ZapB
MQWSLRACRVKRRLLTVAGAAQVGAKRSCFPFHRNAFRRPDTVSWGSLPIAGGVTATQGRCYHFWMQEDLDLLGAKVSELAEMARALRDENQRLRSQLVAAGAELDAMRQRVDTASERLDALLERLPAASPEQVTWKT